MSVKVIYQDVAPGAAEDASVSSTGADTKSDVSLLPFGSQNTKDYATMEHNLWLLDGTKSIYDNGYISFWSNELTDENGEFSTSPTITVIFDSQYTSLGISLAFGGDAWCNNIAIAWYQGSTLKSSKQFYPDAMTYFCENTVESYNKIVITLNKTSLPYRRAKLDEIMFGVHRVFNRDELRGVKLTEEIDPTNRELPANAMDWTLSSKKDVDYIFQFKQPVLAYNDDVLYGVYYVESGDKRADRLYDVICTDAIGLMDNDAFPDAYYSNQNAADLIRLICSGYDVEIDNSLTSKTVTGVLYNRTRRGALQQVCFAIGAIADTSDSDKIRVLPLGNATKVIPANRTRIGASVKTTLKVTAVKLTSHSYSTTQSDNADEITINGVKYYDTKSVTTIVNPDVTASDKPNVVEVTDCTLISSANVNDIAQYLYDQSTRNSKHNLKFRVDGEGMGDKVQTVTPWGDTPVGHYVRASIVLSGFALADAEVII